MADHWYIVQCNPNCERKAAAEIRRLGYGVHLPRLVVIRRHHRTHKTIMKRRPLMTGYIFMRFRGPENWYTLRQCQGVKGVLYIDGHPYRMPRQDVAAIIRAQRSMDHEDGQTRGIRKELRKGKREVSVAERRAKLDRFSKGMNISAPMSGAERVIARIEAITKKGTVRAIVITGEGDNKRHVPVEFTDIDSLEVIDEPAAAA